LIYTLVTLIAEHEAVEKHMNSLEDLPLKLDDPLCPVRDILDHVGDKWSVLVISNLADGSLRFSEIKRRIGKVSQRMLTETVRSLERDGILSRTVYPTIPPKVEYTLTSLGSSLVPLLLSLVNWATNSRSIIHQARSLYDRDRALPVAPVQTSRAVLVEQPS
jgi:DNA-binding HxlR family transcriptional regulator